MVDPNNVANKNLMPFAIVISALIVAGAVIFTGLYLKGGEIGLEKAGEPAAVVKPGTLPEESPEFDTATLENFAQCLKDKGMKFFGAHWCGWCGKQREEVGPLGQELLYIECMDEETEQMTAECQQQGIQSFPTWILADGAKSPGYKPLQNLAELSGCELE